MRSKEEKKDWTKEGRMVGRREENKRVMEKKARGEKGWEKRREDIGWREKASSRKRRRKERLK